MAVNYNNYGIRNRANRLLNVDNSETDENTEIFRPKIDKIYQNSSKDTSNDSIVDIFPKVRNPFAFNKSFMRNADIMPTNNLNNTAKTFISSALGNSQPIYAQSAQDNPGGNTENFNANVSNSSLGSLDIAKELPKLSVSQIAAIIDKHFGNSKVMSSADAQGIYDAQQETGMSALAMLGIGALESGWGTSNIANKTNNIWGYGATNVNPEGNAHRYSQMSEGAKQFAREFMKTYYNGYGAKSINSAGTGSNPKGMGYAYNDDGSISSTWAPQVSSIMSKLYDTAKSAGSFGNNAPISQVTQNSRLSNLMNTVYGRTNTTGNNQYMSILPQSIINRISGFSANTGSNMAVGTARGIGQNDGVNIEIGANNAGNGNSLVNTAKKYLGVPYVWGGETPSGFDCSGLMQYVMKQNGISIPRTSQEQFKSGTAVSHNNLQPGDLVFFKGSDGTSTSPGHVGMYVGNGQYIQAPRTGDKVKISSLSDRGDYVGARRMS